MNPDTGTPYFELIEYIQRLFGMAIRGGQPEHILPIFTGRGRNGKSVMFNTIKAALGDLASPIPSELLLDQGISQSADSPSPVIMSLKGLRLAWGSETAEGRKFSIDRIKWLTGDDLLTGRNLNEKQLISFKPSHTLCLLTNDLPQAPAHDYAFWERVNTIPHKTSFVNREPRETFERVADTKLAELFSNKEVQSSVLAWLVEGNLKSVSYTHLTLPTILRV